jgi:AraC-like DNA-binding protein
MSSTDTGFLHSSILFNDLFEISQVKLNPWEDSLADILLLLETEYHKPTDKYQHVLLKNYLHNILVVAERERRKQDFREIKPSPDLDYVLLFRDLLEKNFKMFKSVAKYASSMSITDKRLNKATTAILDKTPKQMIDERVLLEARRLLVHSNTSIREVAFELGFDEPTNFIKYFRKHIQSTPSEFRENFQ